MACTSPDFHQKSFRIKHDDDKLFTRLLSRENSKSNSSLMVYYGDVSSAVPFIWEVRPGTPKHEFHENWVIPPLTPPPSYYNSINLNNFSKQNPKSKLHILLRRLNPKKSRLPSSSSSSLASPSCSSSSCSSFRDPKMSTPTYFRSRRRLPSWGSDEIRATDDHRDDMCTSRDEKGNGKGVRRGYSSVYILKKAFLAIFGRGSA